jgi:RimJ/RimL family protein N-acetyltransferase
VKETLLKNNGVGIRPFRPDDVPLLFEAARESLNELRAYMSWCGPDYSLEDSRAFIAQCDSAWKKGEQYNFAIFDAQDDTLLGSVGLNHVDRVNRCANIGYWVRRTRTRHGVATAATRLIAVFGLGKLGLHRLEILVPSNNPASQRVAKKAGAQFEGVLRNKLMLANEPHDAVLYSVTPEDLIAPATPLVAKAATVAPDASTLND